MHSDFSINHRVKEIRTILNLNQEELAKELDISQPLISKIEKCRADVSDEVFDKLHNVFHISKLWLRTGQGDVFSLHDEALFFSYLKSKYFLSDDDISFISFFISISPNDRNVYLNLYHSLKKNTQ